MAPPLLPAEDKKELSARVANSVVGAFSCMLLEIGDSLGLYAGLKEKPVTSAELAAATGCSERWVREWLHQQAAARFVSCDSTATTFWLSEAQANVLVNEGTSPAYAAGFATGIPHALSRCRELKECFKSGLGLSYDSGGVECACSVHRSLRTWMRQNLVARISSIPGLKQKLEEGVHVADVGCGAGQASLLLGAAFPKSTFVGYDISNNALKLANDYLRDSGLTNVSFSNPDMGPEHALPCTPTFHLVLVLDALHDMTRPDLALQAIRQSLLPAPAAPSLDAPGSEPCLLIGDIKSTGNVARNLTDLPLAPMFYGFSVAICMSSALSQPGGLGLGTLGFHEATARSMSQAAGFTRFDVLDWESMINAYYLVRP